MKISVDIEGKLTDIDVPDDATPQEIDGIVNENQQAIIPSESVSEQPELNTMQKFNLRGTKRFENIAAPTEIGEQLGVKKTGSIADILSGIPERAIRTAGAVGGEVADIAGTGVGAVFSEANKALGGIPGKITAPVLGGIRKIVSPVIEKYQTEKQKLTPAQQANMSTVEDELATLGLLVTPPGVKGLGNILKPKSSAFQTARQVKKAAREVDVAPKSGMLSTLDARERNILYEPVGEKDIPFPEYGVQAKKSMANARELSAMDMSGIKAKKAFDELDAIRSETGAKKGALIREADQYSINNSNYVKTHSISKTWDDLLRDRGGVTFDARGNLRTAPLRVNKLSGEQGMIKEINAIVNQIGRAKKNLSTPLQLDDAKAAIRNIVENYKASQAKSINTITEGIGKKVISEIDNTLSSWANKNGFSDLSILNKRYGELKHMTDFLNKRLGEVVDAETGQTRMGASLMKSAVMSNSDRGSKALFEQIKNETGHDLIKDAMFAKIAMDAVGDTRATDLLRSMAETKGFVKDISNATLLGTALNVGAKTIGKLRGDKLSQLINYYNKVHSKGKPINLGSLIRGKK
jgi:hypothetical protein